MCYDQAQQNLGMQESHKTTSQLTLSLAVQFLCYAWLAFAYNTTFHKNYPAQLAFSWSPKQNCQLRWLHINISGVRVGLSFTVKYYYYFTETKELNV